MNEIKEKIKDLELALNYVCYDADLIPKLQTVWQKLELLQEAVNKNDLLPDVSIALSGFMDWLWLNHNILTNADNNKIALEKYLATL